MYCLPSLEWCQRESCWPQNDLHLWCLNIQVGWQSFHQTSACPQKIRSGISTPTGEYTRNGKGSSVAPVRDTVGKEANSGGSPSPPESQRSSMTRHPAGGCRHYLGQRGRAFLWWRLQSSGRGRQSDNHTKQVWLLNAHMSFTLNQGWKWGYLWNFKIKKRKKTHFPQSGTTERGRSLSFLKYGIKIKHSTNISHSFTSHYIQSLIITNILQRTQYYLNFTDEAKPG